MARLLATHSRNKMVIGIFDDKIISVLPAKGPGIWLTEDDIAFIAQKIKESKS